MCGPRPCDSQDCTWGELHRRRCEGRMVANMSNNRRTEYLEGVAKKRGTDAAKLLREDARDEWRKANGKQ